MSRSFTSRPTASQTQGRGRGNRGRGTQTATGTNQPSIRGDRIPPPSEGAGSHLGSGAAGGTSKRGVGTGGRAKGAAGRGSSRGMYDPNGGYPLGGGGGAGRGNSNYGRGNGDFGRGAYGRGRGGARMGYGMEDEEMDEMGRPTNKAAGPNQPAGQQERMQHTGAYTVISPNEKNRRQILNQAERETRNYEEYKKQNKPTYFSHVGTAGGGESVSIGDARQQQIQSHFSQTNKTIRKMKADELKQQTKRAEDAEFEKKKAAARKQTELKEQREKERGNQWQSDMRSKNLDFLDRLEAQGKMKAADAAATSETSSGRGGGDSLRGWRGGGGEGGFGVDRGGGGAEGSRREFAKPLRNPSQPTASASRFQPPSKTHQPPPAATFTPSSSSSSTNRAKPLTSERGGGNAGSHGASAKGSYQRDRNPTSEKSSSSSQAVSAKGSNYAASRNTTSERSSAVSVKGNNPVASQRERNPATSPNYAPRNETTFGSSRPAFSGGAGFEGGGYSSSWREERGGGDDEGERYSSSYRRDESGGGGGDGEEEEEEGEVYYDQLEILQSMFPQYETSVLVNILEQCGGSVEDAVDLINP